VSTRRPSRPLNMDAVRTANEAVWNDHPELERRKLTMGKRDYPYRKQWMDEYLKAGGTEAPDEASDTATQCMELGNLAVVVTNAIDANPIEGADVTISGPEDRDGKTDPTGTIEFLDITPGEYFVHGVRVEFGEDSSSAPVAPVTTNVCNLTIPKGCDYLKKPGTVEAPKKNFDGIRGESKLGPGEPGKHKFPGDINETDAVVHEVEVRGRKVKVITPKSGAPKGRHLPSADQVADGLSAVPGKQLDTIKEVVVSPNQNPDDAYWAVQYGIKDFSSAATGGNGGVTFYPKKTPWKQEFVDSTTIHEGGHTYSQELWKNEKEKKEWEEVIKKDKVSPSTYADSSVGEDFSESLVMYSLSKGTQCEAMAKWLYPERYKKLDALFED